MDFTIDEKKQIIKWVYETRSLTKVVHMFRETYGYERSRKSIHSVLQRFEKHGCIRNHCNKCTPRVKRSKNNNKNNKNNDESEGFEIMVCAAAELELSSRDIALELGVSQSTVSRILRRNGYGKIDFEPEKEFADVTEKSDEYLNSEKPLEEKSLAPKKSPEEKSLSKKKCTEKSNKYLNSEKPLEEEMYWEKKKQIIEWYYAGNTPSKIVQLFMDTYKHDVPSKAWVCHIIALFNNVGCICNCIKCTGVVLQASDIIQDIKLEDTLVTEMPKVELSEEVEHSSTEQDIEFVSVAPAVDTFLTDETISKKRKRRKAL